MRKIRIKIKHLAYTFIFTLIAILFLLPNAILEYARLMESHDAAVSKVYYKRYISLFPFGNRRAEALYSLAQNIAPGDSFEGRYKIYPTGSGSSGKAVTKEMIDNAVLYYNEILEEYKDSKYYIKAYSSLIEAYIAGAMFDKSNALIEEGLKSKNEEIKFSASKYKILMSIIGKKYDEGRKTAIACVDKGTADADIYMLLGDLNFYDRKLDDAEGFYMKAKELTKWKPDEVNNKFTMEYNISAFPDDKIKMVEKLKGSYSGDSSIHGRVTINGKPAPYVYIYLKDEKEGGMNSIGDERWRINAITDFNGEYVIPSLPEGNYMSGTGIPTSYLNNTVYQTPLEGYFHLERGENKEYNFIFVPPMKLVKPKGTVVPVDNKVELEWEKVEGASYYYVRLIVFEDPKKMGGSYAGVAGSDKITGTKYTLDLNKINMETKGFMMDDKGILNPQAYLGIFYPGSTVPLYIEAYDKSGGLIKSSMALKTDLKAMAIVSVPGISITESDKLILGKKAEDAAKSYEKDLGKNPNDIHAMMVLSKIYSIGTSRKYDPGNGDIVEGRNRERAAEFTRKLYYLTKEPYYLKASLGIYFTDEPNECRLVLEQYKNIPEEYLDGADYQRIAELSLNLKEFAQADRYFEKIYNIYKDTNYYDLAPVVLKLYMRDYESSIRFLEILDLKLYKVDRNKVLQDIKKLKALNKQPEDYKRFEEALERILTFRADKDYKKQYINIFESIKDPILSDLLRSIGNYYYVFENY